MDLKWLEDFLSLAGAASFSRSADEGNVTQPALSRRIRQLEDWVGATLIDRATFPVRLTPAGEAFATAARDVLQILHDIRDQHWGRRALEGEDLAIDKTVRGFFQALALGDELAVSPYVSADFYAFDAGERHERGSLCQLIRAMHADNIEFAWILGSLDIYVDGGMAWASWRNNGHINQAPRCWQESAVLRRAEGCWRIVFLHSSRAKDL